MFCWNERRKSNALQLHTTCTYFLFACSTQKNMNFSFFPAKNSIFCLTIKKYTKLKWFEVRNHIQNLVGRLTMTTCYTFQVFSLDDFWIIISFFLISPTKLQHNNNKWKISIDEFIKIFSFKCWRNWTI